MHPWNILQWPSQSHDLIKSLVGRWWLQQLEANAHEKWAKIPQKRLSNFETPEVIKSCFFSGIL